MLMMYLSMMETAEEQSLFEQIYYTYRKQMFYVAKEVLDDEHLAEDALQEAFLGVAKQITLFRNMADIRIRAYALTATKNAAINICKQEEKIRQHHTAFDEEIAVSDQDLLGEQINKETYQLLISEIYKLSAFQRDILLLRYSNNMTCAQIAIALGRKASTVRKELSRARQALRNGCRKEGLEIED